MSIGPHASVFHCFYGDADEGNAKEVTLEDFRHLMNRLEEQKRQMESLDEKADVGVVCINVSRLKEGMLPSPISCLGKLHAMLPKLAAGTNMKLCIYIYVNGAVAVRCELVIVERVRSAGHQIV